MQILILIVLPCIIFCTWICATAAQTLAEKWRQKNTRIQYLEQQIAALEAFKNTAENGRKTIEEDIHNIKKSKEEELNLIDDLTNIYP